MSDENTKHLERRQFTSVKRSLAMAQVHRRIAANHELRVITTESFDSFAARSHAEAAALVSALHRSDDAMMACACRKRSAAWWVDRRSGR